MKQLKHFLVALMLLAGQSWAAFSLAVSVPAGGSINTDVQPPALILQVPNQTTTAGQPVRIDLGHHLQCAPYFGSPVNNCVWSWLTPPASPATWSIDANGVLTLTGGTPGTQTGLKLRVTSSYNGTTIINSNAFSWTVQAPAGGGVILADGARNFFVCPDAPNDNGVGNTYAGRWKTISKVNSSGFLPGDDVYFCNDGVFELLVGAETASQLKIDWSGTGDATSQRVIIGAYYVVGGVAYSGVQTQPCDILDPLCYTGTTAKIANHGSMPWIRGTYRLTCRLAAFTCRYGVVGGIYGTNDAQAAPNNINRSLVEFTLTRYVTIQDLAVTDSAGNCVGANNGNTAGEVPDQYDVIIQRNVASHCGSGMINVFKGKGAVIRDNRGEYGALHWYDGVLPSWPMGIGIAFAYPAAYALIENNTVIGHMGEALGCYGTAGCLVRGNRAFNSRRTGGTYMPSSAYHVVEQNIFVDGYNSEQIDFPTPILGVPCRPAVTRGSCSAAFGPVILPMGIESPATAGGPPPRYNDGIVYRNNMMVSAENGGRNLSAGQNNQTNQSATCNYNYSFKLGDGNCWTFDPATTRTGAKYLGNTFVLTSLLSTGQIADISAPRCTNAAGTVVSCPSGSPTTIGDFTIANNAFVGAYIATNNCSVWAPSGNFMHHNLFQIAPTDSDCNGTGSVTSTTTGLGAFNFNTAEYLTPPVALDFRLASTSAGVSIGTPFVGNTYINMTYLQYAFDRASWKPSCASALLSEANWRKDLYADYCNVARSATPNAGAYHQ